MRQVLPLIVLLFLSVFARASASAAESIRADHVQIDLLAPEIFAEGDETFVGIRFRPDEHWHVYWKNPGDSGAAPKFTFKRENAEVGAVQWPYPTRLPIAHLTNLGYEGETAYLFKVKTPSPGSATVTINLEWLVCQEECVPGFGELKLSRPVRGEKPIYKPDQEKALDKFAARLPSLGRDSPYTLELKTGADNSFQVEVHSKLSKPSQVDLFPIDPEYILPAQPQVSPQGDGTRFTFQKSAVAQAPAQFAFLLVADGKAFEFTNLQMASAVVAAEPASFGMLILLLGSALLGGILLNLMPCVFPVISIKAVSLLKNTDLRARKKDGLLYSLGVLTTFTILGLVFLFLRSLGSAVGWGFQLQSPLVVLTLIFLFWLMALNFIGVFDFGTRVMNSSGQLNWHSSFGAGVLSVFIAAPCTGPFMGTALGATATLPSLQALLVFVCLGAGLALPYLAITLSNRLAAVMPRPGAWMETLKEFLAFPLFATVLWLIWVLGQQTGTQGWVIAGTGLLGLVFALWLGKRRRSLYKPAAWIFALGVLVFTASEIQKAETHFNAPAHGAWETYSPEKLQAARSEGKAVFIDFTAAWCITCQVNKKVVLETAAADQIFSQAGIVRLRADWTKQDPVITQALAQLGRNSVPVYAFYAAGNSEALLLPQILTLDMIRNLIPLKEEK